MASKKTRLLIDGDHIVFAAAAAVEEVIEWPEPHDITSVWADRELATDIVERHVANLKDEFMADEVLFAVSNSKTTFRHDLAPDYKGNRKAARPIILRWLRRWTEENMDAKAIDNIEADDVIGISATHPRWEDWHQIIVTEDKDLKTIPGQIYFPRDDELINVTKDEADLFFYCQVLSGDTVDNFPGCPGIGTKIARELLSDLIGVEPFDYEFKRGPRKGEIETRYKKVPMDNYWDAVVSHFNRAGLTEDDAILQARLAYILQYENYDFKKGEPILWHP